MDASGRENSSDSVAIDTEQSRVKLTKFKVLPPEDDNNQRQQIERQQEKCNQIAICAICLNRNNQKIAAANAAANKQLSISNKMSPIVNSTPTNEPEKREQDATIFANNLLATNSIIGISLDNDNYKTTNSSDLDERNYGESSDDSSGQFRYQNNSTQHQYDRNRQEFQIIWRQLAFEVSDYSRENKQISGALSKLGQLWRLKTSSSARQQLTISREEFEYDYKNPGSVTTLGSVCDPSSARSTPSSNSKRVIFENLNGYVKSGEVSAILGPSGAGKTSLLTAICGRTENYRGSIQLIGGAKRRLRLSIIPQKDYLLDNLTVRESLLFASKILDPNKSSSEHEANISRVVKMLNLIGCLDSDVSKISGGEYKRVSIAQELISQPDILVLDEPTSGLDSLNCKKLIKSLIGLVEASRQGKIKPLAVVMTIHQPDIDVFNMFDHVYCMARGGNVIYDGHPQDAMQTIRDYAQFSPDRMPPELEQAIESSEPVIGNPANMLIEIASEDLYGLRPIENLARVQQKQFEQFYSAACQNTGQCSDAASVEIDINLVTTSTLQLDAKNLETKQHKQQAPPLIKDKRLGAKRNNYTGLFWYHTRLLTQRAFLATLRDPLACIASLVFHLLLPFIMFTVYSRKIGLVAACPLIVREMDMLSMASNKTLTIVEDLQEQLTMSYECSGMFFLTTYSFSMCSTAIAALAFPLSMHVLLKEVRNGWYNMPTYVTAKTIASLPFEIMFPVVSIIILYFILGMPSSYLEWRLWGIALTCAGVAMIGQTIGLIFGALFMDSVQTAVFLGLAASLPQALLSGYTARIKQMPMLLQHLSWLSPFRYSMDLINMFRFGFGMCPCDAQMDEYLRTTEPRFADIPDQMRPLVSYYLRGALGGQETGATETTIVNNATGPMLTTLDGGQQNSTTTTSLMKEGAKRLLGINYDFILNSTERETIISQLESSETDLFKQMADQLTRSFAFGRKIDSCSDAKSQLLVTFEAPEDEELANMLLYLFALLVIMRIILLIIVKLRVGARL